MKQLGGTEMKRLHREWRRRTDGRLTLLLDSIASPFNLGSVFRTAAAYRVDHIWIAASQIDPTNTKAGRTALGSDRYVTWSSTETVEQAIAEIAKAGDRLVGVELADYAAPMHEAELSGPICLAIGHEDRGLSKAALTACDSVVFLPQLGKIGSLNLSSATAIAIWEVRRQHWAATTGSEASDP